jgi:hypothetical protein
MRYTFKKNAENTGGSMKAVLIDSNRITLPPAAAKKIMGKTIEIVSLKEGILLKPVDDAIAAAKGVLKKHSFSTKKYLLQKKEEKKLES